MTLIYEIEETVKFRKVPALQRSQLMAQYNQLGQHEREVSCARRTGHILMLREDKIICSACGATWKDEGF